MPIARITGPGLCAIGLSVALLWGCLIEERVITRRAAEERARAVRQLDQLRHQLQPKPVSAPVLRPVPPPHMVGG